MGPARGRLGAGEVLEALDYFVSAHQSEAKGVIS
jgi:hypothetical protein